MNEYEKVLVIFEEQAKKTAKHNKLIKIKIETEDNEFYKLLAPVIAYYAHCIHSISGDERKAIAELREYCTSMAYSKKPQWQVLAERNGWCKK